MPNNLPPLIPPSACTNATPVSFSTPVLLRTAIEGPPFSNPAENAELIISPPPPNDDIVFTADEPGVSGNLISVEVLAPLVTPVTSVDVIANAIVITPGSKARLIVTGSLENIDGPITFPELLYVGPYNDGPEYQAASNPLIKAFRFDGGWIIQYGGTDTSWTSLEDAATPDLVVTWTPQVYAVGVATVTAAASSAAQVIDKINNSVEASALISVMSLGVATGPVGTTAATFLTGGVDGSSGTPALSIGQLSRVGPYPIISPRTQSFDWFIAETLDTWRPIFE
jgi:hypothetical protein